MAKKKQDIFTKFTSTTSSILGRAWVFVVALALLLVWSASGPLLGFSDTWQLIINTSTTIVIFLMVFIIQNTQNRDNIAMNIKLDAILKKNNLDYEDLLDAEMMTDKELEKRKAEEVKKSRKRKK